jgi:hypothetical protein
MFFEKHVTNNLSWDVIAAQKLVGENKELRQEV